MQPPRKSLLEIGGSLPNDLLFDNSVDSYVNIESPDYIDASQAHLIPPSMATTKSEQFCNAEEIDKEVNH